MMISCIYRICSADFFFAEYYVAAVMLCVFGGDEKEWIDSNPQDAI